MSQGQATQERLLSTREVAEWLGVDRRVVYQLREAGEIEAVDVSLKGDGSRWKYERRAVEKFIGIRATQ